MVHANVVANLVINKAYQFRIHDLTNLKLQKLLYLISVYYAKNYNEKIFKEEFHAWRHGPVIKEVYNKYRTFGSRLLYASNDSKKIDSQISESIDAILEKYGQMSAWELVKITHNKNSGWDKAVKREDKIIHYKEMVNEDIEVRSAAL